ncbi:hypothetical protein [Hydrogenimonas sp.]
MRYACSTLLLASALHASDAGLFSLADPLRLDSAAALQIHVQALVADDPVSVHDLFNRWQGAFHPKEGTNLAVDDARTDIGFSTERWGYFGYTYRHQSFIRTNRDTVLLAWQQLNDIDFTPGKRYDLRLQIDGFEVDGLLYAKRFEPIRTAYGTLRIGIGVELLRGRNMQEGYLYGDAVANSQKDYDFNAVSDYRYSENYLYNLRVEKPDGYGYTSHLSVEWRDGNSSLRLLCNDLWGEIRWRRLPYSHVNVSSATKSYDENGFVIYNPTISGIEKYIDATQRLYRKWRTEGSFKVGRHTLVTAGSDWVKGYAFPYAGIAYRFENGLQTALSYENRFGMFGIGLDYKTFRFALESDRINDPSALALSLSCALHF